MGYYTNYNMEVIDIEKKGYNSYLIAKYMFNKYKECDWYYPFEYSLNEFLDENDEDNGTVFALVLENDDASKWYDNEKEMIELSKEFPDVLFKLHGAGEESEDIWDEYFMNGKSQYCEAEFTIPPFDRDKLI